MNEQTHTVPEGGLKVWFAVLGSIAAWLVHLSFVSSFVQYTCNVSGVVWVQHLVTAITAGATLWAMALSLLMVRELRSPWDLSTRSSVDSSLHPSRM